MTIRYEILKFCYLGAVKYFVVGSIPVDDVGGEIFPWDACWAAGAFERGELELLRFLFLINIQDDRKRMRTNERLEGEEERTSVNWA